MLRTRRHPPFSSTVIYSPAPDEVGPFFVQLRTRVSMLRRAFLTLDCELARGQMAQRTVWTMMIVVMSP